MKQPIGIAGAGRVARALGRALYARGEPVVCVAGRRPERAAEAAAFIGAGVAPAALGDLPRLASRLLLCVPDDAIGAVAAALDCDGGIALHTSGNLGPEALAPLSRRGVHCGALHPLQTVASGETSLGGAAFAVAGDAEALGWAREIAALLGGRVLEIDPARRPLYHAAAVMAGNYVIALAAAARDLMIAAGVPPGEALPALAPLARTSLENALALGPEAALTGPIERGDSGTVAAHLAALETAPEAVRGLYRSAGRATLEIARRRGLDPAQAATLETLLRQSP